MLAARGPFSWQCWRQNALAARGPFSWQCWTPPQTLLRPSVCLCGQKMCRRAMAEWGAAASEDSASDAAASLRVPVRAEWPNAPSTPGFLTRRGALGRTGGSWSTWSLRSRCPRSSRRSSSGPRRRPCQCRYRARSLSLSPALGFARGGGTHGGPEGHAGRRCIKLRVLTSAPRDKQARPGSPRDGLPPSLPPSLPSSLPPDSHGAAKTSAAKPDRAAEADLG